MVLHDSRGDRVDGYYKSYQSSVSGSEITFNVKNETIKLDAGEYSTVPKLYKNGVEVEFHVNSDYPAHYIYTDDMRGDYDTTYTFRIVSTTSYNTIKIMYQTE